MIDKHQNQQNTHVATDYGGSLYGAVWEEYEIRGYKPFKLIIEWEVLCDTFPEKFTYYDKVYDKNIWRTAADNLISLLFRDCLSAVVVLINENDPRAKEKTSKYQQTFDKFPQCQLGVYSGRVEWIRKNAFDFKTFVGNDSSLRKEKDGFSRKSYLIPKHLMFSQEKAWNVSTFDNDHSMLPQSGGLRDEDIIECARNLQDKWNYFNKPYDKDKRIEPKKHVSNSEQKSTQQSIKKTVSNDGNSSSGSFWMGAGLILLLGLVIWFIWRRKSWE